MMKSQKKRARREQPVSACEKCDYCNGGNIVRECVKCGKCFCEMHAGSWGCCSQCK
jgi:hypothetical protein